MWWLLDSGGWLNESVSLCGKGVVGNYSDCDGSGSTMLCV